VTVPYRVVYVTIYAIRRNRYDRKKGDVPKGLFLTFWDIPEAMCGVATSFKALRGVAFSSQGA
jgi:hypothetical protein